jgi:hypothetical protein
MRVYANADAVLDRFDATGEIGVVARAAYQAAMHIAPAYAADGWQCQNANAAQMIPPGVTVYRKASAAVVRNTTTHPFKATGRVVGVEPMTLAMMLTEKLSDVKVRSPPGQPGRSACVLGFPLLT